MFDLSQRAIDLVVIHSASLKDLDCEAFTGLAMLSFLDGGRETAAKFVQNLVMIFDRFLGVLFKFWLDVRHI